MSRFLLIAALLQMPLVVVCVFGLRGPDAPAYWPATFQIIGQVIACLVGARLLRERPR